MRHRPFMLFTVAIGWMAAATGTGWSGERHEAVRHVLVWRGWVLPPWSERQHTEVIMEGRSSEVITTINLPGEPLRIEVEAMSSNRVVYSNGAVWESQSSRHSITLIDAEGEDEMEWLDSDQRYIFSDGTRFRVTREQEVVNQVVLGETAEATWQAPGRPERPVSERQRAMLIRRYQLPFP